MTWRREVNKKAKKATRKKHENPASHADGRIVSDVGNHSWASASISKRNSIRQFELHFVSDGFRLPGGEEVFILSFRSRIGLGMLLIVTRRCEVELGNN
jgi:hypothetical protein